MLVNLLAAIIATCDFDETAAPASPAAEYHSRCYKFVGAALDVLSAFEAKLDRLLGAK